MTRKHGIQAAVIDAVNGLFAALACILCVIFVSGYKIPLPALVSGMFIFGVLIFGMFRIRYKCILYESRFVNAGRVLFVQDGHCVHNGFDLPDGRLVLCENEIIFYNDGFCYFEYAYRDYDITADLEGEALKVVLTGRHDWKYGVVSCFTFVCEPVKLAVIYDLLAGAGVNFDDEFG